MRFFAKICTPANHYNSIKYNSHYLSSIAMVLKHCHNNLKAIREASVLLFNKEDLRLAHFLPIYIFVCVCPSSCIYPLCLYVSLVCIFVHMYIFPVDIFLRVYVSPMYISSPVFMSFCVYVSLCVYLFMCKSLSECPSMCVLPVCVYCRMYEVCLSIFSSSVYVCFSMCISICMCPFLCVSLRKFPSVCMFVHVYLLRVYVLCRPLLLYMHFFCPLLI